MGVIIVNSTQSNLYRSLLNPEPVCCFNRQRVEENGFGEHRRHIITPRQAKMFRRFTRIMRKDGRRSC